ncbi:MAG TPA: lmo0937 family membrane protein [Vicinamibacterales bacterium]|nr:lmo0937 family membrane protein [Vicinamibacterales bacterium]
MGQQRPGRDYHLLAERRLPGPRVTRRMYPAEREGRIIMLYTIAVILVVLWLLGLVSSYTMGGFIHVLLVIAIIVVLLNIIQGRRVL